MTKYSCTAFIVLLRPIYTILTCLSINSAAADGVRGAFLNMAMARLNQRVTNHLFESILKQELGFFDKNRTGK